MHVCYLAVAPLSHMWHLRPPHRFLLTWLKHLLQLPTGIFFFNELVNTSCPQDSPRVILGLKKLFFSSLAKACSCSVTNSCFTHCGHTDCCNAGFPVLHYLLEFAQTHVHWFGIAIQPSHPLSPTSSLALNLSQHQNRLHELVLHIRWPECWSFSTSPSNEYSELISFRMDWFDLLAIQGTFKSVLQCHSSKASVV